LNFCYVPQHPAPPLFLPPLHDANWVVSATTPPPLDSPPPRVALLPPLIDHYLATAIPHSPVARRFPPPVGGLSVATTRFVPAAVSATPMSACR